MYTLMAAVAAMGGPTGLEGLPRPPKVRRVPLGADERMVLDAVRAFNEAAGEDGPEVDPAEVLRAHRQRTADHNEKVGRARLAKLDARKRRRAV